VVVLAGVDVDRRGLDRVLYLLELIAGRDLGRRVRNLLRDLAQVADDLGDVGVAGDVDRRDPADVGRPVIADVGQPRRRVDPELE